ncbi:cupin domain-containing protein [Niveibacterium sp. SC-1]|uniref:cupin domain-containing protein n=1 Tax=Niveibacterium sp. SC-1 TaxID=3135646 RepID=UPI00311F40F3
MDDETNDDNADPKLEELQIGGRLKHARILQGMRMRELAERVGCAESMISKIESGKTTPSIVMLQRLVTALNRDLSSFFGASVSAPGVVQKAGERPISTTDAIRGGTGTSYERLIPFAAGNLLEGNIHRIEPGAEKVDTITHQGETMGYVIEGELDLTIDTTTYRLGTGDSFFFKNHLTSRYRNPGTTLARVLWVNTPQVH